MEKVNALFLSDVHLGSKGCKAEKVMEVLKSYDPKHLFLVGDFIDGWLLQSRPYWPQSHVNVLQKVLKMSKKGTKVIYITGNHDDFLRNYDDLSFGNIKVVDEYIFKKYYIVHGDFFDGVVKMKWLGKLGSIGYELSISIDLLLRKIGFKNSISSFLKYKVKEAVKFISKFELELARQARLKECKGVICGHIHTPEDKYIDKIHYLNCGDWIQNNSFLIFNNNKFKLIGVIDGNQQ